MSRQCKRITVYYVHAFRPSVDHTSTALITVKPGLRKVLELIESEAARVILGAPRWTKVTNLMEATLFPLVIRIDLIDGQSVHTLRAQRAIIN